LHNPALKWTLTGGVSLDRRRAGASTLVLARIAVYAL
jgi:hypothetical protein